MVLSKRGSLFREFVEGDAGGDGDVEGFFLTFHRDFEENIEFFEDFRRDAVDFFAKDENERLFPFYAVVGEAEARSFAVFGESREVLEAGVF